jgi:hypothetical protein
MLPPFKFFKSFPGQWRVDGISHLSMKDGKSPRVIVCFSRNEKHIPDNINFIQKNLPFNAIMWFTIGSIWESGRKISNPKIQKPLTIDTRDSRQRSLNEPLRILTEENNGTEVAIIPATDFSFGGRKGNYPHLINTKYEILKTTDEETPYIIIPHSEIYRFYWGVSTRLCNSIIMDEIERYVDWGKSIKGYSPTLVTRTRLSRVERYVFLRALSDDKAMQSMRYARKCLDGSSNQKDKYIKARFPFKGRTSLTCAGQRICLRPSTERHPAVYGLLAMQLLSCSYIPNINDPTIVEPAEEKGSRESNGPGEPYNKGAWDEAFQQEMDELFDLGDNPADKKIRRLILREPSNRFQAMTGLKYRFENLDGSGNFKKRWVDGDDPSDCYTIAEGDYAQDNLGCKGADQSSEHQPISRDIENFIKMMGIFQEINKVKNWKVEFLSNTNELVANGVRLSSFPKITGQYKWYLIQPDGQPLRPRHAAWAQITLPGERENMIYLVEIELKPNEDGRSTAIWIPTTEGESLTESDLNAFLELTAVRKRWPKKWHDWGCEKRKDLADKLLEKSTIYTIDHLRGVTEYTNEALQLWAKLITEKIEPLSKGLTF